MRTRIAAAVFVLLAAIIAVGFVSRDPAEAMSTGLPADAAIVLSGDVDYLRITYAAGLFKSGRVKALLLTGQGVGGDSAVEMRQQAIAAGVPAAAISLEMASTSTRENLVFSAPIIAERGWRRVAIVTSQSHLARALATARKAMPYVEWVPAPVPDTGPAARALRLRVEEALKLLWYRARGWA